MEKSGHTHFLSSSPLLPSALLVFPPKDWDVSLWLPRWQLWPSIYFPLFQATNKTYCSALCFYHLQWRQRWGMGKGVSHMFELNRGWMFKPGVRRDMNQFKMSEQEEGKMMNWGRWQRQRSPHGLLFMSSHIVLYRCQCRKSTIKVCIKGSVSPVLIITYTRQLTQGLSARPRKYTKRIFVWDANHAPFPIRLDAA